MSGEQHAEVEPESLRLFLPPQYRLLAPARVAGIATSAAPTAALAPPVAACELELEGSPPFLSPQYRLLGCETVQARATKQLQREESGNAAGRAPEEMPEQQQSWDVAAVVAAIAAATPQGSSEHVARLTGAEGPAATAAAAVADAAAAASLQGMSDAEVRAAAEAEGLTLVQCSDHRSGFKGVKT
jgi:hypothetical protein